jgi:hypothetical protein
MHAALIKELVFIGKMLYEKGIISEEEVQAAIADAREAAVEGRDVQPEDGPEDADHDGNQESGVLSASGDRGDQAGE